MVESLSNNADQEDVEAAVDDHTALGNPHTESASKADIQGLGQDSRRAINQLVQQNADQDFELGLELLEYDDGQYEAFVNDARIRESSVAIDLQLGSELDSLGYATLGTAPSLQNGIGIEWRSFTQHTDSVNGVFVTDTYGYSVSGGGTVRQWDPETLEGTGNVFSHSGAESLTVTNSYGYSGGNQNDSTVRQWDPDTMEGTGNSFTGHSGSVNAVAATSSYGYSVGGLQSDYNVYQWDLDTMEGTGNSFTGHSDEVIDISVAGSYGYTASEDGTVRQWDLDTMEGTGDSFTGHDGAVDCVYVTNSYGYSGGGDSPYDVYQWDPDTMEGTGDSFTDHGLWVRGLFVTDSYGYSAGGDDSVYRWDPDTMAGTGEEFNNNNVKSDVYVTDEYVYAADSTAAVAQIAGEGPATAASTAHTFEDVGFTPTEAVINDQLRQPLSANATVYYQIEDADGNSKTIPRSDIDTTVDISGFTSSNVSTTALIERDDDTVDSPQLDSWALYLTGQ